MNNKQSASHIQRSKIVDNSLAWRRTTRSRYNNKARQWSSLSSSSTNPYRLKDIGRTTITDTNMLDLEVRPERSLGCDQWEFILGKYWRERVLCRPNRSYSSRWSQVVTLRNLPNNLIDAHLLLDRMMLIGHYNTKQNSVAVIEAYTEWAPHIWVREGVGAQTINSSN